MSVRAGDTVAITPSGVSYAEMRPEDVCLVTLDGTEPAGLVQETPSSETPMHLAIYAATKAGAVVHTHSPEVIALSAAREELPGHPLRDHRPGRPGPRRALRALRVGGPGRGGGRGAGRPQRRHPAQPRRGDLRPQPGAGLRPGAAARMAGPHLPAGAELRGTLDPVGRRTRRGHGRVPAPPLRRAARPPASAGTPRERLATGTGDRARRAHPGRAGPPGRDDPARPGQRPAEGDPGHRRGHGRRDRCRPGQAGRQGARRRRARRRPARRHRDRRDVPARRRHQRAGPQKAAYRPRPRSCPSGRTESAPPSTSRARRACSPAPTSTWSKSRTAGPCSSAPRTRSPG